LRSGSIAEVATQVLLDVDTGIDDALAMLYASAHPELDVVAVTCVSGNVALPQVVTNTCAVLGVAGAADTPVGRGAETTLRGIGPRIGHRHGANGLGDLELPSPERPQSRVGAVELMRRRILDAENLVTLVALAPQTNLAMLIRDHLDEIARSIERLIFVGGRLVGHEQPEFAEFNVGHDPEAAAIVIGSGLRITMYGLDVFDQVVVSSPATEALAEQEHRTARLAGQLLSVRDKGLLGDAGALIALTNPELFTSERARIRIGLHGAERGRTLRDPAAPSIEVVTAVNAAQAAERFVRVVSAVGH
jgi:pyrimidine-specific ribonucleoside hydrolase